MTTFIITLGTALRGSTRQDGTRKLSRRHRAQAARQTARDAWNRADLPTDAQLIMAAHLAGIAQG